MSYYSYLHGALERARKHPAKVMNNTYARFEGEDIVVRHFNTDLFKIGPDDTVTILNAYDSVTSKRRFAKLAGIHVYAKRGGVRMCRPLSWGGVGEPYESGVRLRTNEPDGLAVLRQAEYWLSRLAPRRGSRLRDQCDRAVERWRRPFTVFNGKGCTEDGDPVPPYESPLDEFVRDSGLCLVDPHTGCYVRLLEEADKLRGVDITLGYAILDGKRYDIEPAQDYARGGKL